MQKRFFVYRVYFPASDKCYVGQTCDIERRMQEHLKADSLVCRALWKYDDWEWTILHTCKSRDEANRIEIEEIRNFGSLAPGGYNLTFGGEGGDTFTNNPNKEAIRERRIGKKSPEHSARMAGECNSFYGKKHTEEAKQKNREAHIGKEDSAETTAKRSTSKIGSKNSFYGKKHSDESRAKMGESTNVAGDKNPFYGKKHAESAILKMQISQKKWRIDRMVEGLSPETLENFDKLTKLL